MDETRRGLTPEIRDALLATVVVLAAAVVAGALLGRVGIDLVPLVLSVVIAGLIVGTVLLAAEKHEEIEDRARYVVERPERVLGAAVVAAVVLVLAPLGIALLGTGILGLAVTGIVTAGAGAAIVYGAKDEPIASRPLRAAGAIVGGLVVLFAAGIAFGAAGLDIGAVAVTLGLAALVVGTAVLSYRNRERLESRARYVVERPQTVLDGAIAAVTVVLLAPLGIAFLGTDILGVVVTGVITAGTVALVLLGARDERVADHPARAAGSILLGLVALFVAGAAVGSVGITFGGVGGSTAVLVIWVVLLLILGGGGYLVARFYLFPPEEAEEDRPLTARIGEAVRQRAEDLRADEDEG